MELQNLQTFIPNNNHLDNSSNINYVRGQCHDEFWMPIIQVPPSNYEVGNHTWIEDFEGSRNAATFIPWMASQPNGRYMQKCMLLDMGTLTYLDEDCHVLRCSLCQFGSSIDFTLRGLFKKSVIDQQYIFVPGTQTFDMLSFFGHKTSKIYWIYETNQWTIVDTSFHVPNLGYYNLSSPETVIGRIRWSLTRYWDPNDDTPDLKDLKLTKVQYDT